MKYLVAFISFFICIHVSGQELNIESEVAKLIPYIDALQNVSNHIPQEKVYLHFDNTNYYQGDHIWFKSYVVTSAQHQLSNLSETLYVELLNPGGEIIDKRILKIENGQCHGEFILTQLPFYSGFYEVRAYTRYMLNFGDDAIFSRLLPVFDRPKTAGNFEEKAMLSYGRWGTGNYPMKRERPIRESRVNVRFFPEGGNQVQGIASRVAFEATDETGNPIDVTGVVKDRSNQELVSFDTLHEGRGVFTRTPGDGRRNDIAEIEYAGRKYRFDLPTGLSRGVIMEVDNLSHPDNIGITLKKNSSTPSETLGVVILHGGQLQSNHFVRIADDEIVFSIDKARLPPGVSQIVLFNGRGEILCDRLIFITHKDRLLDIRTKTDKPVCLPFGLIEMGFSITDRSMNPVNTTFSLSVRDGANMIEGNHTILTDLLLMSELKGYVRNPSWYFEDDDNTRRAALDALLMVQGWRRYSWSRMAGIEPFVLEHFPEQGIETHGRVVSMSRQIPQPNVDISLFLLKRGEEDEKGAAFDKFVTDEQGRFAFRTHLYGKWGLTLAATEKGKKKGHRILIDRLFSPEPRRYSYADLQVNIMKENAETVIDEKMFDDFEYGLESFLAVYQDSLSRLGIDERVYSLDEVTVTAKRRTRGQDIYQNRSNSVVYYDVQSELDDIFDSGKYVGDYLPRMLLNLSRDFSIVDGDFVLYKNRPVLFVVDYEPNGRQVFNWPKYLRVQAIKSIYINETLEAFCQNFPIMPVSCVNVFDHFSGVVFIETFPDGEISVDGDRGVRKTWLDGYSPVKEFYSPNYSELPPALDYRRTLYWNPSVTPDETGNAKVQFYNNSRSTKFNISAETVTSEGMIGVL